MRAFRAWQIVALAALLPAQAQAQDQDGDGVPDAVDQLPCDGGAAAHLFAPAEGVASLIAFEDLWPSAGDLDFNDAVLAWHYQLRLDGAGRVVGLTATFTPLAVGGDYDNGLGLHLPVAKAAVSSVARRVAGGPLEPLTPSLDPELTVVVSADLRELFGHQRGPINAVPGPAVVGAPIEVELVFAPGATLDAGLAPFDLYLFRRDAPSHEIHRPEYAGTMAMDGALFGSHDDGSSPTRRFVDKQGLPFALVLPTSAIYPAEGVDIAALYPDIATFARSGGAEARDFYATRVVSAAAFSPTPAAVAVPALSVDTSCVPLDLGSPTNPGATCVALREAGVALSGLYWLDPNGGAATDAFQAWCDMDTDGGGWTLAGVVRTSNTFDGGAPAWHVPGTFAALTPDQGEGLSPAWDTLVAGQVSFHTHQEGPGYWASFALPAPSTMLGLVGTARLDEVPSGSYRAELIPRGAGSAAHTCWSQPWRVMWRDYYSADNYPDSSVFAPSGAATGRPCGGNTHYATGLGVRTDTNNGFSGYGGALEGYGSENGYGNRALTNGYVGIYVRERAPVTVALARTLPGSCSEVSGPSGVYTLDPSGGDLTDAFDVWCDMDTAGGGWTLAAVLKDPAAWAAGNDVWHTARGTSGLLPGGNDGKSWAYSQVPGRELLIRTQGPTSSAWAHFLYARRDTVRGLVGEANLSTQSLSTARDVLIPVAQGPGAAACFNQEWRVSWAGYWSGDNLPDAAIFAPGGAASGRPCGGSTAWATGIGVRTDVGNGWGGYGASFEGGAGDPGGALATTGGYVALYVRDATLPANLPTSCAGVTGGTGYHMVDPTGGTSEDAAFAYCDMSTDGGGWTLVMSSRDGARYPAGDAAWHDASHAGVIGPESTGKSPFYATLRGTEVLFGLGGGASDWASFTLPGSMSLLELVGTTNISAVASGSYLRTLSPKARGAAAHGCWGQPWRVTWRDYYSADNTPDSAIFAPSGAASGRPCGGHGSYATGIGVRTDTSNGFSGYGGSAEGLGSDSAGNAALTRGAFTVFVR
jgi:LruC domain-containing protein